MLVCMGIWICKIEFRHMFHESQDTCKFRYAIKTIPCCCKLSGANPLHQRHSNSPPLSVWVQVAPRLPRLHYVQSPRFLGDWQQNKTHVGFSQGIPQCKTVSKKRNGKNPYHLDTSEYHLANDQLSNGTPSSLSQIHPVCVSLLLLQPTFVTLKPVLSLDLNQSRLTKNCLVVGASNKPNINRLRFLRISFTSYSYMKTVAIWN